VADQAAPGTMTGTGNTGAQGLDAHVGPSHVHEAHHGRPASWVAVAIIVVGFIIGGIALPVGPTWWLFWLGTGIVVVGGIFALSVRILDDWY
jgi:nitrate/nitrite transporter NarK